MVAFDEETAKRIASYADETEMQDAAARFLASSVGPKYSYNFCWLGRPIIQYPQDIVAFQELVWALKPDLIVETGIAHGGSLILSASLLSLIDYCEALEAGVQLDPQRSKRRVVGVDIEIRPHNRAAIDAHPMRSKIEMIEGSSVDVDIAAQVAAYAKEAQTVLVCLDSNHTHSHVLQELNLYTPMVTKDSYCVVFDTLIEDMPSNAYPDRPWAPGNNPKTAVNDFLRERGDFIIDTEISSKLLISAAPDGWLKRIS